MTDHAGFGWMLLVLGLALISVAVVAGSLSLDSIVGGQQPPCAYVQAGNNARQENNPRGIYAPPVAAREALDDRLAQRFRRRRIAEDAMLDARGKRIEHRPWRAEIRIGDPQRDDVAAGVAVPAQAPGSGPVDRRVEIYFFCGVDSSSFSSSSVFCCSL